MSMETYRGLLARFGAAIGLPDLAPDDSGYAALSFDDTVVNIQYDLELDDITFFTRLGTVDDDEPGPFYARLLAANLFWAGADGATLSLVPESQEVFLARKAALSALDDAGLAKLLEAFIGTAEAWRREVETYSSDDAAAAPAPLARDPDPGDGVIRV